MSAAGLRFEPAQLTDLREHAAESHPFECCGMVFGPSAETGVVSEVVRVRNIQDELHARDPESYPRDARSAYFMDEGERDASMKRAAERGLELRGFYHSHPDHGVYFSQEDRRLAAPEGWGELFPGVSHIVISTVRSGVLAASEFLFDSARNDYDEIAIDGLTKAADRTLDLGDTPVPGSLIETRDVLRRLDEGDVLEVLSQDAETVEEAIPGYCDKQRFPVDRVLAEDRVTTRLRITKTA